MFDQDVTPEFLEFCGHIWAGLEHADSKHGDWKKESKPKCFSYIYDEVSELEEAIIDDDIDSEHGIKAESVQVAVTAFKLWRRCHQ